MSIYPGYMYAKLKSITFDSLHRFFTKTQQLISSLFQSHRNMKILFQSHRNMKILFSVPPEHENPFSVPPEHENPLV